MNDETRAKALQKARSAVLELLGAMNVGLEGSRDREEIVDRVLAKFGRTRQQPQIEQALAICDAIVFVTDAHEGCTPIDRDIARALRTRDFGLTPDIGYEPKNEGNGHLVLTGLF